MEVSDDRVMRAVAHFMAARRLRDRLREDPTLTGLAACAAVHVRKAATFAQSFCDGGEFEAPFVDEPATVAR